MMYKPLFLFVLLVFASSTSAQLNIASPDGQNTPQERCLADEMHQKLLASDPQFAARQAAFDAEVRHRLLSGMAGAERSVITIPVVVHIIHDNGPENISDAQVIQGIAYLNAAYSNTGYYDQGTGVDTEIQFCLAARDPNGNATTGIDRVQNVLTDVIAETQDIQLKDLSRWDPLSYLNIWLVRSITSASVGSIPTGYAFLPSAHGQPMDGVVVEAEFFGSSASNSVVGIHEIGHYLGLYHTFEGGCTNNDCLSDGDRVCDTPPDGSTASIACLETLNSCSSDVNDPSTNNPFRPISLGGLGDQPDDTKNYMDYGSYLCKSAFTQGQKDRMQEALSVTRESLLHSHGCDNPCSISFAASFTVSPTPPVNIGTLLQLTNTTGPATGFIWSVNGTFLSNNTNETYEAVTEGLYTFSLTASDSVNHCLDHAEQVVEVSCPGDATFTVDHLTLSIGGTAVFTNTSTGATGYTWYVDGSAHSTEVNESITFDTPGVYSVYLVAHTPECENTSVTQYIQVGNCQRDGYRMNWYFGYNSAMDFNSGTPQVLMNSAMTSFEGSTSISDDDGNLLFYSNGLQVWDRNHNVMPNGSGLMGGPSTSSRHQALGTPYPGHPGKYLLFTTDENENLYVNGLRYSVIDMSLNGGLGAVTATKNIWITGCDRENIAAAYASNGTDFWLLVPNSNYVKIYRVDQSLTFTPQIMFFPDLAVIGSFYFSNNGKKVAWNNMVPNSSQSPAPWDSWIYDFDLETGILSNPIHLVNTGPIYEFEFSPDDSKLYKWNSGRIVQYDLSLTTEVAIQNSATTVLEDWGTSGQMRNGPDGKLYFNNIGNAVSRLDFPNLQGTACSPQLNIVPLGHLSLGMGLPLFIKGVPFDAATVELSAMDTVCIGSEANIAINAPGAGCTYTWLVNGDPIAPTSGDTLLVLPPQAADSVLVRVNMICDCGAVTTTKWIHYVQAPAFALASDPVICAGQTLVLGPPGLTDHLWQDGSTGSTYTVADTGTYWLQARDPWGCTVSDTVHVDFGLPAPVVDLGPNDTLCVGHMRLLDAGEGPYSYSWQDHTAEQTYTAFASGTYWVTVSNNCGSVTDSISILQANTIDFSLGDDQTLCSGMSMLLQAPTGQDHYLWQDNSAADAFMVDEPGTYWVEITDNRGCASRDTIVFASDTGLPTLLCPPDTVIHISGSTVLLDLPTPIATNDCSVSVPVTLTNSINGTNSASGLFPLGTAVINWTAVDNLGNTTTCSQTVTVSNDVGVGEVDEWAGLLIFPDPSDGLFTIVLPEHLTGTVSFDVFNYMGAIVKHMSSTGNASPLLLDLSQQAEGAYKLRLTYDGGVVSRGLIIAR